MAQDQHVEVHWHEHAVSREERERLNGHRGCVVWFTGLSASGKSTVANLVDHNLHSMGVRSFVLDGDNIRHGLNAGPGLLRQRHGDEFAQRFGLGFSAARKARNRPRRRHQVGRNAGRRGDRLSEDVREDRLAVLRV